MIKLEPKTEPYEMDAEYVSVEDLEPERARVELGDELEDEPFVPVAKVPKKQPNEVKVKKPRKNQPSVKRIQLEENGNHWKPFTIQNLKQLSYFDRIYLKTKCHAKKD